MSRGRDTGEGREPVVADSLLLGAAGALRQDQLGTYERAMRTHGDLARFRIGPPGLGFVFDAVFHPEGARRVLATDARDYDKGVPVVTELARVFGDGLVTSEGARWALHRRIIQPQFTRQRVHSYTGMVAEEARRLVESWRGAAGSGRPVDLHEGAVRFSLGVLERTVLGGRVGGAVPVLEETLPALNQHVARRGLSPVRLPAWVPTTANRRAERARAALHGLVGGLVQERQRVGPGGQDLISRLLEAEDPETGTSLDAAAVRNEAVTFLVAGQETTASALAFTLDLLGRHQAVQDAVRKEAVRVLGKGPAVPAAAQELELAGRVVHETLRLLPPVHTLVRRARRPVEVLGRRLPAGRVVAVSVWGIHRHPDVWSEPGRFAPDRFAGSPPHRYAHLPFGGGPRACVGAHLALLELTLAVAAVTSTYHLRAPPEHPELDAGLTLRPGGPVPCRLEPVSPAAG